jgi:hypothetical protein
MNRDVTNLSKLSKQILSENAMAGAAPAQPAPAQPAPAAGGGAEHVEQMFANGVGQDVNTVTQQVQALAAAQQEINPQIQAATQELEAVRANAERGNPVEGDIDPVTGDYRQAGTIQKLNQQYTRLNQLAQEIMPAAQQFGVDVSVLKESLQQYMDIITEHKALVIECLVPGTGKAAIKTREILGTMIEENVVPSVTIANRLTSHILEYVSEEDEEEEEEVEEGLTAAGREYFDTDDDDDTGDPDYLKDVLGMEPEDFAADEPDQSAMDRADAVDLANNDRPSADEFSDEAEQAMHANVPECDMIEKMLDGETRAVMDDEDGNITRREAREIAKDILKAGIDQL